MNSLKPKLNLINKEEKEKEEKKEGEVLVSFRNITKTYPKKIQALKGVSFDVKEGEFICLAGKSGAGKTTLLRLLLGEEKPSQGQVFFKNIEVQKLKPHYLPLIRRRIGAIFQDYKLIPSKTTYENVAYVMELMGFSDQEIKRDVPKVLEIVGLEKFFHHFPNELSGGEKQRAAIARALINRPELICADEPTGNLDPYNTRDVIKLLLQIQDMGTTVILSTHDKDIINSLKKRVITLEKGELIKDEEKGRFIC
jgi:cell division transport system ATP-binding protein